MFNTYIDAIVALEAPREDRAFANKKRLFRRILEEPYLYRYKVLTLLRVIQRSISIK